MSTGLAIFFGLVVIYGAVAVWLGRFSVTMPIIFVVVGLIFGPQGLVSAHDAELLVEMTLALLLFADASTLDFRRVRESGQPATDRVALYGSASLWQARWPESREEGGGTNATLKAGDWRSPSHDLLSFGACRHPPAALRLRRVPREAWVPSVGGHPS